MPSANDNVVPLRPQETNATAIELIRAKLAETAHSLRCTRDAAASAGATPEDLILLDQLIRSIRSSTKFYAGLHEVLKTLI